MIQEQQQSEFLKKANGWGIDADLEKRPYKPVHRPQTDTGAHWTKPEAQPKTVEVLKSNERPDLTAVYGTVNPPRGLSGIIRRWAFKSSENNFSHWLPLMLADRIDFIEGLFEDAMSGKMPRIFGDGYYVDYKYNRKKFYVRVAKNAVVTAGAIYLIKRLLTEKTE
jgi:hypothetical protein